MKKTLLLLACLLALQANLHAQARPYVSLSAGGTETSVKLEGSSFELSDFHFLGNLALGAEVHTNIRAEIAYQFRQNASDSITTRYYDEWGNLKSGQLTGTLKADAVMANFFYRLATDENNHSLWFGLGVGEINSKITLSLGSTSATERDHSTLLALYFLGSVPITPDCDFDYGIEFYKWDLFDEKMINVSPRIAIRYFL